jgi:hypothetical protein
MFKIFCGCLLLVTYLYAVPIKVPTERYTNFYDTRAHPGHYPFISHLTFRNICDHAIDNDAEWFDPETVGEGDTIYCNIWYLDWFVNQVHDQIKHPYILVSCDVGAWYPHPDSKRILYDPKLVAWFCRNMVFSYHPKLFQIPWGQDIFMLFPSDRKAIFYLLEAIANKSLPKEHLLYMNHCPRPHGERDQLIKMFEHEPYCFSRNHSDDKEYTRIDHSTYYKEMASCQFVLSPLGLETDSVRTWEALVLDCIPIVEHTFLDTSYDALPVVMVHDWKEVNPYFLREKYQQLKDRTCEKAYFDYWFRLIKGVQKKVRKGDLSHAQLEATQFSPEDLEDLISILGKNGVLDRPLVYKGLLCALRPFQLAYRTPSTILLYDSYLDHETFNHMDRYLIDPSILKNRHKITCSFSDDQFLRCIETYERCPLFLDLTYYRTSLLINFVHSCVEYGNFRQSLRRDLNEVYKRLKPNSFLCGNMVHNQYVKEVLEMFSNDNQVTVSTQGSFWYLHKK